MSISIDTHGLNKAFASMEKAVKNKIAKKAVTAGVKLMAKAIKREIPSKWKDLRKAIGYRFARPRSGAWKNVIIAKSGAGVGIKKAKRAKMIATQAAKGRVKRGKHRKGVGQSVANIHWFLAGTEKRYTGTKRVGAHRKGAKNRRVKTGGQIKYTGRLKKPRIVQKAEAAASGAAEAVMKGTFYSLIMKEAGKQ